MARAKSDASKAPTAPTGITELTFESDGRTFECVTATSPATPGTYWWWVSVSGESQRYAAFRAEPRDTAAAVQPRVESYYAQLLIDRARPREIRPQWGRPPGKKTEKPGD